MKEKRKKYDAIRNGIDSGVYKCVRLIQIKDGERIVLLPFNSLSMPGELEKRMAHIRQMLEKELAPGTYLVECRNSHNKNGHVNKFEFVIEEPKILKLNPSTGAVERNQEGEPINAEIMESISLREFLDIMQENSDLKAENDFLKKQLEMALQNQTALSDPTPVKTGWDRVFDVLGDNSATLLGLADKFMQQRDKRLELDERMLSSGVANKKNNHTPKVIKRTQETMAEQLYKKKLQELAHLYDTDPDQADAIMDELEETNPELYQMLCADLGIDGEEEEEEE